MLTPTVLGILAGAWIIFIVVLFIGNLLEIQTSIRNTAIETARTSFQKDLLYRQWATVHGGVYVPVTEKTPPNPYLTHVSEQNITTPGGIDLTLMNPAYMTRQVHELANSLYNFKGHITSLKPLRPENAPDPWEVAALNSFEEGNSELIEITDSGDDGRMLRYMGAMYTEEGCLKCHAEQGYNLGDVRGGISVAVSMDRYDGIWNEYFKSDLFTHIGILIVGTALILIFGISMMRKQQYEIEMYAQNLKTLEQRETLLKELHHRTKNNMQVISSLLQLQAANTDSNTTRQILKDAEGRIESMALVHKKLYQTENLSHVDFNEYARDLGKQIEKNRSTIDKPVRITLSVEPVEMLIDTAIPLGLVIHELVINGIKHNDSRGECKIAIELHISENRDILLEVRDNGPGFPEDFDYRTTSSLGMQLILAIVEEQLQGKVEFIHRNGLTCRIRFKDELYKQRV